MMIYRLRGDTASLVNSPISVATLRGEYEVYCFFVLHNPFPRFFIRLSGQDFDTGLFGAFHRWATCAHPKNGASSFGGRHLPGSATLSETFLEDSKSHIVLTSVMGDAHQQFVNFYTDQANDVNVENSHWNTNKEGILIGYDRNFRHNIPNPPKFQPPNCPANK
jgi:hypothetical protein